MIIKAQEFRDASIEELHATYDDYCKELFNLRSQQKQEKKLEKPHRIPQKRKDIARLLTVLREKKIEDSRG